MADVPSSPTPNPSGAQQHLDALRARAGQVEVTYSERIAASRYLDMASTMLGQIRSRSEAMEDEGSAEAAAAADEAFMKGISFMTLYRVVLRRCCPDGTPDGARAMEMAGEVMALAEKAKKKILQKFAEEEGRVAEQERSAKTAKQETAKLTAEQDEPATPAPVKSEVAATSVAEEDELAQRFRTLFPSGPSDSSNDAVSAGKMSAVPETGSSRDQQPGAVEESTAAADDEDEIAKRFRTLFPTSSSDSVSAGENSPPVSRASVSSSSQKSSRSQRQKSSAAGGAAASSPPSTAAASLPSSTPGDEDEVTKRFRKLGFRMVPKNAAAGSTSASRSSVTKTLSASSSSSGASVNVGSAKNGSIEGGSPHTTGAPPSMTPTSQQSEEERGPMLEDLFAPDHAAPDVVPPPAVVPSVDLSPSDAQPTAPNFSQMSDLSMPEADVGGSESVIRSEDPVGPDQQLDVVLGVPEPNAPGLSQMTHLEDEEDSRAIQQSLNRQSIQQAFMGVPRTASSSSSASSGKGGAIPSPLLGAEARPASVPPAAAVPLFVSRSIERGAPRSMALLNTPRWTRR